MTFRLAPFFPLNFIGFICIISFSSSYALKATIHLYSPYGYYKNF